LVWRDATGQQPVCQSIIAVDIDTGQRVWDFPTGPNLLTLNVDGREIQVIAQVSKQAFTYVLDRATGEPVCPIEERPVPQGNVPGEWYSPTQPFPTKPPPFEQQGRRSRSSRPASSSSRRRRP
jgi:quinoprotein glucose dehydrogenase